MAEEFNLGERIATLRGRRSQTELAAIAGVDAATLNRIERGKRKNPSKATLTAIARALDVDLAELLDPRAPIRVGIETERLSASADLVEALDTLRAEIRDLWSVARDGRAVADQAQREIRALAAQLARQAGRRGRRSA